MAETEAVTIHVAAFSLTPSGPSCAASADRTAGSVAARKLGIFTKNPAQSIDPRTNRKHHIEVAASNPLVTGRDLDVAEACSF